MMIFNPSINKNPETKNTKRDVRYDARTGEYAWRNQEGEQYFTALEKAKALVKCCEELPTSCKRLDNKARELCLADLDDIKITVWDEAFWLPSVDVLEKTKEGLSILAKAARLSGLSGRTMTGYALFEPPVSLAIRNSVGFKVFERKSDAVSKIKQGQKIMLVTFIGFWTAWGKGNVYYTDEIIEIADTMIDEDLISPYINSVFPGEYESECFVEYLKGDKTRFEKFIENPNSEFEDFRKSTLSETYGDAMCRFLTKLDPDGLLLDYMIDYKKAALENGEDIKLWELSLTMNGIAHKRKGDLR